MGLMAKIRTVASQARSTMVTWGERRLYQAVMLYYAVLDRVDLSKGDAASKDKTKGVRSPVFRLIEFYVAHLWPGPLDRALPIEFEDADNPFAENLETAIGKIWQWSNWAAKKQLAARKFALTGDLFLKAAVKPGLMAEIDKKVYIQVIEPSNVIELELDELGWITRIRIDIELTRRKEDGSMEPYTYVELWTLADGMRVWETRQSPAYPEKQLGDPTTVLTLEEAGTAGFIPIVHAPFRDVGATRGINAFWSCIDKIDEADAIGSKLHQMAFRGENTIWAVQQDVRDSQGRPLTPLTIRTADQNVAATSTPPNVQLGTEMFVVVNGSLQPLIPPLNYGEISQIVDKQVEEITRDLPELKFYDLQSSNQIATETLRLIMAPALARLLEARSNGERAISRVDAIALTMAQKTGIPGFEEGTIGTWELGSFHHVFKQREVWDLTAGEQAELQLKQAQALQAKVDAGIPFEIALEESGYSADDIEKIVSKKTEEDAKSTTLADKLLEKAQRQMAAGGKVTTVPGVPGVAGGNGSAAVPAGFA